MSKFAKHITQSTLWRGTIQIIQSRNKLSSHFKLFQSMGFEQVYQSGVQVQCLTFVCGMYFANKQKNTTTSVNIPTPIR